MRSIEIIILAAGLGTRMKSDIPKVLHKVCGQPMLTMLIREIEAAIGGRGFKARFNIVVGHGRDQVISTVEEMKKAGRIRTPVVFTVQDQQLGTGHAVRLALENGNDQFDACAVFNGDLPLFTSTSVLEFLDAHVKNKSFASLASSTIKDAGQYGRVLRKGKNFVGVVEYKDATAAQRKICEYNGGVYLFDRKLLSDALKKTGTKNAQGEFYLPDVFAAARKLKKKIHAHHFDDAEVLAGVNNMKELAEAQGALYWRTACRHMDGGVFIHDPDHTFIGPEVRFGRGCVVGPFTSIHGDSSIGDRAQIGAHCQLTDVTIGAATIIRNSCVFEKSSVGKDCAVGPMVHLRPGAKLADDVRVGNFVEIKESQIGSHTNAAHLSYIGDADIGSGVNIGCGFVTCNYDGLVRDGKRKHRSVIGDNVFVGSDCQVVAPIQIADGSFIASGSTVTDSVPESDSMVIARTRQITKPGYAKKYRK